jgi:uncharacterized protein YecE (DUF72 family)
VPLNFSAFRLCYNERMGAIHIGTLGFSYDDWVGPFYPLSVKGNHRLDYYAGLFRTVELNSSFYHLPALPAVSMEMLKKVAGDFEFFAKVYRDLTHVRRNARETLPRFHEMLKAYRREHKLAGVLFPILSEF